MPIMGYAAQALSSPQALTKSRATPKEDIGSRQFESPHRSLLPTYSGEQMAVFPEDGPHGRQWSMGSGLQVESMCESATQSNLCGIAPAESRRLGVE